MSRYPRVDPSKIKLNSVHDRESKVEEEFWGSVYQPNEQFDQFVDSLPDILAAKNLRALSSAVAQAAKSKRRVLMMIGGHVIKTGLVPILCDLVERGIINGVAMNSAAAIHDVESALFGKTSEDVAAAIDDGSFGMASETGQFINGAINRAYESEDDSIGLGEAIGESLLQESNGGTSIIATALSHNVPVTVHVAIGADIIHQQPSMSGAATGELSHRDFLILAEELSTIGDGGAVLNVGSAVILPEVFLKALTVARNVGYNAHKFTAANFDMIRHYRPRLNVLKRPTQSGGTHYDFAGHHEIMIPLFAAMVKSQVKAKE